MARQKASSAVYMIVLIGAVVTITAAVGYTTLGGDITGTQKVSEGSMSPEQVSTSSVPKDVKVGFERGKDMVAITAYGGNDLSNVTSFSVSGASVNGTMDPSSEYPQVTGRISPPTTVMVNATFEDGTTQTVAEKQFS